MSVTQQHVCVPARMSGSCCPCVCVCVCVCASDSFLTPNTPGKHHHPLRSAVWSMFARSPHCLPLQLPCTAEVAGIRSQVSSRDAALQQCNLDKGKLEAALQAARAEAARYVDACASSALLCLLALLIYRAGA
eukprot:768993-Pelagomonas_calceolata.AAC.1